MGKPYHVYIIESESDQGFIKVGKTNNTSRVKELNKMGYAGKTDYIQKASILAHSDTSALALEGMINSKLSQLGHKLDKIMWFDLVNKKRIAKGKPVGATEMYRAPISLVISVALHAANTFASFMNEDVK